ncbi:MAG: SIR2 family protein [Deltaproteobacteria bacterium]|nr:SIR2 family protein [Deltaproteobacteria bacterium]
MASDKLPLIFSPEETKENETLKEELFKLVSSNHALLLVGTGSSAVMGYDTWDMLLLKLERLACECGDGFTVNSSSREDSPLDYVREIKKHIEERNGDLNEYHKVLYKEFSPRQPRFNDFHRTLVHLPFKGILTTNYDTVLEAALGARNPNQAHDNSLVIDEGGGQRVSEFLLSLDFDIFPKRIAHLHGRFDHPQSIILCLDDYVRSYGLRPTENGGRLKEAAPSWSLHRKILWAILSTRRVVFIGFSMKDPYLSEMLRFVSSDLWRWNESIHYAVMDISPENADECKSKAQELKRNYGVETVFYENIDGTHFGLEKTIYEAARFCKVKVSPDWIETINLRMEESLGIDENRS